MRNITLNIEDNTGGIDKLWYVPVEDVISIPEPVDYTVLDPIVMESETTFYTIQFSLESPGYDEKPVNGKEGKGYNINVAADIPGHNPVLTSEFTGMTHRRFIVVAQDQEGKKRLIGTLKNPCRFRFRFDTGNKSSARKGYVIEFYQTVKTPPPFYESPFIDYGDEFSDDADYIQLDALLASLSARVTAVEDDVEDLELEKLDRGGDTSSGIINYSADFSASYTARSLIDKEFAESLLADIISNEAFGPTWDGITTEGASKDALFDLEGTLLRVNGTRSMAANLNMGANQIINTYGLLAVGGESMIYGNASSRLLIDVAAKAIIDYSDSAAGFGINTNAGDFNAFIKSTNLSANRTWEVPNRNDTFAGLDDIDDLLDGVPSGGDTLNKLYNLIVGIGQFAGAHDASGGLLPTVGTGASGAIDSGDFWRVSVPGTISGLGVVRAGDVIYSNIANASVAADFFAVENNEDQATNSTLGLVKLYTDLLASNTDGSVTQSAMVTALALKEDLSNKDTDTTLSANSDTKYPSQKAVKTYIDANAFTNEKVDDRVDNLLQDGLFIRKVYNDGSGEITLNHEVEDIINNPFFYDDFHNSTNWTSIAANGGSIAITNTNSFGDLGLLTLATLTNAAGLAGVVLGGTNLNTHHYLQSKFTFASKIRVINLSDGTETYKFYIGLNDTAGDDASDGVYFRYTQATNGDYWVCVTASSGTRTTTILDGTGGNPTIPVTAGNFILKAVINDSQTEVTFYIDSGAGFVLVATHTTNIPAAAGRLLTPQMSIQKTVGTTSRQIRIDFWLHYLNNFQRI